LGLDFLPVGTGEEFDAVLHDPDLWHPWRGFQTVVEFGIVRTMRPIYEAIAERYVPGETVVGAHSIDLGSRVAQERLGVPVASIHLSPVVFRSVHVPPVLLPGVTGEWTPRWCLRFLYWLTDAIVADRAIARPLNIFRAELGLPPVRRVLDRWWYSPDRVIGMFPEWFAARQPDWPIQLVLTGFPLWDESALSEMPRDVRRFLDEGEPPIVFTPGSANRHGQSFFAAAIEACKLMGRRGMLLTRYAEQLPNGLHAGIRHFDYVPFGQLFPHAALIVHHGGIGTVAQGLSAGVPQLVMHMAHDQHDNAARLVRLGVAEAIRPRAFRGPAVARALDRLLVSPCVKANCHAIAARFAGADPLTTTCEILERLAI
jgi:UDP:flavonoid glycosyltransferase YjiC (YdhE family)